DDFIHVGSSGETIVDRYPGDTILIKELGRKAFWIFAIKVPIAAMNEY
ncbi:MAG: hypothetical protein ACI9SC_003129, partial [Gammaproteobacteria bacterium]